VCAHFANTCISAGMQEARQGDFICKFSSKYSTVTSVFALAYRKRENHNHKQGGQNSTSSSRVCLINHATSKGGKNGHNTKLTQKKMLQRALECAESTSLLKEKKKTLKVEKKMLQRQCAESTSLLERKKRQQEGEKTIHSSSAHT